MAINTQLIRQDFPILQREIHPGYPLVYLDSAATTQKPRMVLLAMDDFYKHSNANIHRGVHTLAEEATAIFEQTRAKIAGFIHSARPDQIIFTRNATESINLIANTWARVNIKRGDLIILTEMEHHSNLVPWHMLAAATGARLEFIPVTADGLLDLEAYRRLLVQSPRLVSFTAVSNVLGTINPNHEIIKMAHEAGALAMVDAAQSVPHMPVDVQKLDADFLAFSAHKMVGPTGIGVLYGKRELLAAMPPFMGGGDMIKTVHLREFIPNDLPHKFEAGTPAIAEAAGFGAAIDYLESIGMDNIFTHEREITSYALGRMVEVPGIRIYGPPAHLRGGVIAFTLEGVHPHDVAQIVDEYGVAVRAGHHCAQPLHEKFGIPATTRASFYLYSTKEDVDWLIKGLIRVKEIFN
jgi:cysteine desulfurase/selenocysteine lyase